MAVGNGAQAEYDYIIIGAGSSGCVLAERLSRDGANRVLLIEAGGDGNSFWNRVPKGVAKLVTNPEHIWAYDVAQPRKPGDNSHEVWIRGKGLGGSSSVNGMIWSRGEPADYDAWAEAGCTGWTGEAMTAAFKEIEDHELGASATRGRGGPVHVTTQTLRYPLTRTMIAAGKALGLTETDDLNSISGDRIGFYTHNIRYGQRQSGAVAFLHPARGRDNLDIEMHTLARRILFDNGRACGVELHTEGRGDWTATCRREIIVSAGTMESPQILERSGIGDGALLQRLGIPVVASNPHVGAHLREHLAYAMPHRMRRNIGINSSFYGLGLARAAIQYMATGRGPLAAGPFEVGAFLNIHNPDGRTDLQLYMSAYTFALSDDNHPVPLADIDRKPGLSIYAQLLRLTSEGTIHIRSNDGSQGPLIEPNWLTTPEDQESAIASVRYMRRFMAQPALAREIAAELLPGPDVNTDEEILESFRTLATCGLHGIGTCRMGADEQAVVDPELRVRGVEGLRVVDCSVMPLPVTGNTNAPAMALGWRAADIILANKG